MPRKRVVTRWEGRIGTWPHVVWYGERLDKGGVCYTRVWNVEKANWEPRSCRTKVRDAAGKVDPVAQACVIEMAKHRHDLLTGKLSESTSAARVSPITLGQTWEVLTAEATGRFPNRTPYRDELKGALNDAIAVLGPDFAWMHFSQAQLLKVTRAKVRSARLKGHTGFRAAAALGTSMITIMGVLREDELIPEEATIPGGRRWRSDLKRFVTELDGGHEPQPKRPRYTLDELRRLHVSAQQVDPRYGLLMELGGVGLRAGQVRRARRSNFDLEKGLFRVPGSGKKGGAVEELTPDQLAAFKTALQGYLASLEAGAADYHVFPQGMLVLVDGAPCATVTRHAEAGPVDKRTLNDWHREAEDIAKITHVPGRSFYGLKRRSVDEAAEGGISVEGLQELGGWSSERVPQGIYRDRERLAARHEAMLTRARIRGENVPLSYPETPNGQTDENAGAS